MQLRSNQRKKLNCTFLALTLREVIPLKKMGQNFHICLRSGPPPHIPNTSWYICCWVCLLDAFSITIDKNTDLRETQISLFFKSTAVPWIFLVCLFRLGFWENVRLHKWHWLGGSSPACFESVCAEMSSFLLDLNMHWGNWQLKILSWTAFMWCFKFLLTAKKFHKSRT